MIKKVTELNKYVIIINILNILMEEELNIFKKSSLAFAAIASVLTFAPDPSFVSNQAKAEFPTKPIKVYVGFSLVEEQIHSHVLYLST